jgi:hypothetical protein
MKTIITTFTIAAITLLGVAPQAQARHPKQNRAYISEYRSCNAPVYTERYLIGYDPCGNPVWGFRTVRREYCPVIQPRYIAPCPQPYYQARPQYTNNYQRPCYRNGISIQANFGH